jgi:hypothetical protein
MGVQEREYGQDYSGRENSYAPRYDDNDRYPSSPQQAAPGQGHHGYRDTRPIAGRQQPYEQPPRRAEYERPPRERAPWERETAQPPRPPSDQPYQPRRARHARPPAEVPPPAPRPARAPAPPQRPAGPPQAERHPPWPGHQAERRVMDDYAGHGLRARPSVASQAAALERAQGPRAIDARSQSRTTAARSSAKRKRRRGPLVVVCVVIVAAVVVVYLEAAGHLPPGLKSRAAATDSLVINHDSLMTDQGLPRASARIC